MEFIANQKKNVEIEVDGKVYLRHAVKTHYIQAKESYIDIIEKYIVPIYQKGDIVSISEKIIALCQNRIIYKKDLKLGFWAKFLSKFVNQTPAGEAVGNPYKMQIAINICGLPKVLYAAICAGIGKLFKKKGIFYDIVGEEVSGLDGFCDDAFSDYLEMAILIPSEPEKVCNEIKWRKPIASLNLLLSSNVWQQDHNGYTHLDPGMLDHVSNKKADVARLYLPYDANSLISTVDHCLQTKNYINVIVASKHPSYQWLNMIQLLTAVKV